MYVLELPYISMRLQADDVPSPAEHVQAVAEMLYKHEISERVKYDRQYAAQRNPVAESVSSFFASRLSTALEFFLVAHAEFSAYIIH